MAETNQVDSAEKPRLFWSKLKFDKSVRKFYALISFIRRFFMAQGYIGDGLFHCSFLIRGGQQNQVNKLKVF